MPMFELVQEMMFVNTCVKFRDNRLRNEVCRAVTPLGHVRADPYIPCEGIIKGIYAIFVGYFSPFNATRCYKRHQNKVKVKGLGRNSSYLAGFSDFFSWSYEKVLKVITEQQDNGTGVLQQVAQHPTDQVQHTYIQGDPCLSPSMQDL